ncbi:MAG: High-affinity branched-chain amino acid transport ATP-binding protein LivF [Anaerolineales bacterium]|nr:High-affinity branched-chain amino acid transport ATP-binding protein LivF [Anaerolineales bacterium]
MSLLTIEQLTAGYGKLVVLRDVNLTVDEGQFVAILGPNGSGKSTLVKSVFSMTDIVAGSIEMDSRSLIGLPTESISQHGIAYVPQRENIFSSMTIRENLLLAVRHLDSPKAEAALRDAFELFPILEERQEQGAGQLSGGERQMLAIAIGWLARPRLMLLDEPSAGLAPSLVKDVFRLLRRLCEAGITLAVVEQNARSILRWCDYAYVLREGEIAFQGTSEEILADEETVKGYLGVSPAVESLLH